jgi:hypothetical protein
MEWVVPEGRDYAGWTVPAHVKDRAGRFFRAGRPFAPALSINQNTLDDARHIRNAIAHESTSAQDKFQKLARRQLGTLPQNFTVGRFLSTTKPGSAPPVSFLEFYLAKIEFTAQSIVRK